MQFSNKLILSTMKSKFNPENQLPNSNFKQYSITKDYDKSQDLNKAIGYKNSTFNFL